MRLTDTCRLHGIAGAAAGTQATVVDSRKADDWIKQYLSDKQKRLDDLRKELHGLLDHPPKMDEYMRPEQTFHGSYREDKRSPIQQPGRAPGHGRFAVCSPEGEIISRWPTKEEARSAAWGMWRGISPSATGATGGARVVEIDENASEILDPLDVHAADIFQDPDHQDKTRNKFKVLRHKKPRAVEDADRIRMGDNRPSSHGQGSAGTGGTGAGGAGGGTGI